jgi:hypothetical protein
MFANGGCHDGVHGASHGNKFITFIVIVMAGIACFFLGKLFLVFFLIEILFVISFVLVFFLILCYL